MTVSLPSDLERILREVPAFRDAYLVGGGIRDALLGLPGKDFDVEVFGLDVEQLADLLRPFGRVDLVGRSFGVVKLSIGGAIHDFAIPRRDSKTGPGHRGFDVHFDPELTPREAAARRDFTINALMWHPRTGELRDYFGGADDLRNRVLRHTSPAFVEDPLRVLRGMQFAARFRLTAAPETLELCRRIADRHDELALDRIREEWLKWATRSVLPSAGLRFLEASGWLRHYPELAGLRDIPQDPEWHPEGDVLNHTYHCLDALVELPEWQAASSQLRAVWMLAVLTHDAGKAVTTRIVERDGRSRIVSPGHDRDGVPLAQAFLVRVQAPKQIAERVSALVGNHMAHLQEITDRAVRRLARRLHPETIDHLCVVMTADAYGRPPRPREVPAGVETLKNRAHALALADAAPRPILLGRHLLEIGWPPGREVGRWSTSAFEAQLDGRFTDLAGARIWLANHPDLPADLRTAAQAAAGLSAPKPEPPPTSAAK